MVLPFLGSAQLKLAAHILQYTRSAQIIQYCRQAAPFHTKVIRQLLLAERDGDPVAALQHRLFRKIGEQFFPRGAFAEMADFPVKQDIFPRQDPQHIFSQPAVVSAACRQAAGMDP